MKLLIAEDHDLLRERLGAAMVRRGHEVLLAASQDEALAALAQAPTHAVVDLRLGDDDGLQLLAKLHEALPTLEVLILTGYGSIATAVDAVRLGAVGYLQKPADADMVLAAFERAKSPPLQQAPEYEPPTLARAEWEHIQRVLSDCGGNISEAARRLGLHRRTLQRKLAKFPPRD